MQEDYSDSPWFWPDETIQCVEDFLADNPPIARLSYRKDNVKFKLNGRDAQYSIVYPNPRNYPDGLYMSTVHMTGTYGGHMGLKISLNTQMQRILPRIIQGGGVWFYSSTWGYRGLGGVYVIFCHGMVYWMTYTCTDTTVLLTMYGRKIGSDLSMLSDFEDLVAEGVTGEARNYVKQGKKYNGDYISAILVQLSPHLNAQMCANCGLVIP